MTTKKKTTGFGAFLQQARRSRGITQQALSAKAGVSISTISGQESKPKAHINPDNMEAIANTLHAKSPLTDEELKYFQHSGRLPIGYTPKTRTTTQKPRLAQTGTVGASDIVSRHRGNLRVLADYLHDQIKQEAGAEEYTQRLLQVAESLSIHIPEDLQAAPD